MGVEISPLKTHRCKNLFEFAKRYFYRKGSLKFSEITPFPISALNESSKRFYLLTQVLMEARGKSWVTESIPVAISEFYRIVLHHRARSCKEKGDNSAVCEAVTNVIRGSITADDGMNNIIRHFGLPLRAMSQEESLGVLQEIITRIFTESDPLNQEGVEPLGLLAESLVMIYYQMDDFEMTSSVILADPILQNYGKIEELYMDIRREARRISIMEKGN